MRTTIDLPDDLHEITRSIARDRGTSLSETVATLLRRALGESAEEPRIYISPRTGLPVVHFGRTITTEDVRALDDDE